MSAGAVEDLLAVFLVGLVAARAQRRRRRARQALEPIGRNGGEVDESFPARLDDAAHPVAHAENALHVAGGESAFSGLR